MWLTTVALSWPPLQVSCILVHRCWSKFFGLLASIVGMVLLGGRPHM